MNNSKKKAVRFAGFVGALGVSAVLITTAVSSTGAYFTSEAGGNLSGTSGALKLLIADGSSTSLNFAGLNPGADQHATIDYRIANESSTSADIWLTFDATSAQYGAFTGANGHDYAGYDEGGLGGYGHFKVEGAAGYGFESYNLQLGNTTTALTGPYAESNDNGSCNITTNGNGGNHSKAVGPDNGSQSVPECGVPAAIKLAANVPAGADGTIDVTFGLTGKATAQNTVFANVPFKVVATQPGVRPDAANF